MMVATGGLRKHTRIADKLKAIELLLKWGWATPATTMDLGAQDGQALTVVFGGRYRPPGEDGSSADA